MQNLADEPMTVVVVAIDKRRLTQRDAPLGPVPRRDRVWPNGVGQFLHLQRRHEALTDVVRGAVGVKEGADLESACDPCTTAKPRARAQRLRPCHLRHEDERRGLQLADRMGATRACTPCGTITGAAFQALEGCYPSGRPESRTEAA